MRMTLLWTLEGEMRSVIDYDTETGHVSVENSTEAKAPVELAFGTRTEVGAADVEALIKSRCLEDTRVDKKLWIQKLGCASDAPLDFIRVTEGKMAQDKFGLKIVRMEME